MAPAHWIFRLPIIRHLRAIVATVRVERHYRMWGQLGLLPVNRHVDDAIIAKIWRGEA